MFSYHMFGYILRYVHGLWDMILGLLPTTYCSSIAADRTEDGLTLYAATGRGVFASSDGGEWWTNESDGLPADPYCCDLRVVRQQGSPPYLYLTTYGRSLWRAEIGPGPPPRHLPQLPRAVIQILWE